MAGTPRADSAQRIPATAAAIVDLLNSQPHGTADPFPDKLQDVTLAGAILRPFDQTSASASAPTPGRIAEVSRLRAILVDIVSAPDSPDGPAAASRWAELDEQASSVTLRQDFTTPGRVRLWQVGGDPVVGGITLAVAELVADGTWPRIRVCDNERCRHAFYDTTRSRTQRWHSYEMCGNRSNVAAYRARKKAGPRADAERILAATRTEYRARHTDQLPSSP